MTGIEQAMKDLVSEVTHTVVERLSERYSFDVSEALKVLNEERSPKKKTEKGKDRKSERMTPSIPLPFCGVVNEDWCHGVRLNHGLHTHNYFNFFGRGDTPLPPSSLISNHSVYAQLTFY